MAEPVFCFEMACKTLYWSLLVYGIQVRCSSRGVHCLILSAEDFCFRRDTRE